MIAAFCAGLTITAGCQPNPPPSAEPGTSGSGIDSTWEEPADLDRFFGDISGTFVLLDPQSNRRIVHDAERATSRYLPASTFKIPNSLIALETGVANGPDFGLAWDSIAAPRRGWWPEIWARDHTLKTALPNSVVWFYQELARRIGPEPMLSYLKKFDYGNAEVSGGIDEFWLTGGLRISAEEQVDFMRRFYDGKLAVSDRSTRIVKDLLIIEETPDYRLSGKTGWAALGDPAEPGIGWLVGYIERADDVFFFATNIDIESDADAAARLTITRAILRELDLMGEEVR